MAKVLSVELYDRGLDKAVSEVINQCNSDYVRESKCISATGAHGIIVASKKPEFKNTLDSFYWNLPDGMPGVMVGRLKGAKQMSRCSGPDFFKLLFEKSASTTIKHFLCGGKEGVAEELRVAVGKKMHNYQVVGTYCPPFRDLSTSEFKKLAEDINKSGADIIWIGLSTPKQELFAKRLSQWTSVNFIITVGAAFDFHTNRIKQAPLWIQKSYLEWFYRLLSEPRRLYKRYLEVVPLFIYLNLKEFTLSTKKE